ncbi:MAG: hypothetical protein WBW32_11760 [Luteibacter sp.]
MSKQPRERVSLTLPPKLVQRIETAGRELSQLAGCQLSPSQVVESYLERSLPKTDEAGE